MAPVYLKNKVQLFHSNSDRPSRLGCGRDENMFHCDLSMLKNSTWISKMIFEWNHLPIDLRLLTEIEQFKSKLKAYYFQLAFENVA